MSVGVCVGLVVGWAVVGSGVGVGVGVGLAAMLTFTRFKYSVSFESTTSALIDPEPAANARKDVDDNGSKLPAADVDTSEHPPAIPRSTVSPSVTLTEDTALAQAIGTPAAWTTGTLPQRLEDAATAKTAARIPCFRRFATSQE